MTISPLDGRYSNLTAGLSLYFSEPAMVAVKAEIEADYTATLLQKIFGDDSKGTQEKLKVRAESISSQFHVYKYLENKTNHDIKALEMFLAEGCPDPYRNYIHFGLTSQDINSVAHSLTIKNFNSSFLIRELEKTKGAIQKMGVELYPVLMPARTHGQHAVPTRLGKEIGVFCERLEDLIRKLKEFKFSCKMGGAAGNLSAHYAAYPEHDWDEFCDEFVAEYGMERNYLTTQVDSNISIAEYMQIVSNISLCLLDLCRDMWMYYSYGYFQKSTRKETIGSSTMPQKANPIEFENAEGNLELAINLFGFMSNKLQVSRLQRDLSDSTVFRNIGVPFGHLQVALASINKGLEVSKVDSEKPWGEVQANHQMSAEWLQTLLRKKGSLDPYGEVKSLTEENLPEHQWDERCKEKVGGIFDPVGYSRNRYFEDKK